MAVFSSSYEKYYPLANEVLRKVISCQCVSGENIGLWTCFVEESLEEMVAPDWNMADFHSVPMLTMLIEHKDKLKNGMYELIEQALLNACCSIIKRNLTVIYTNPIVMGTYVLIGCGELFGREDLIQYAMTKLKKFYHHVLNNETYDEYNCPQYSLLIAEVYSLILRNIKNPQVLDIVGELNDLVWTMLGTHFHYETGELTAPNSRQYENFLREHDQAVIQRAVGYELNLTADPKYALSDLMYDVKCPDEIKPLFLEKGKKMEFTRLLTRGYAYPWFQPALTASSFICSQYTLGSFNIMDGWNQHHTVKAFLGNREEKCCIRLRALHDNYDYCSALFTTAQERGTAFTLTNFQTDRGDTHPNLDLIVDAQIKANDLRIRYEIEANTDGVIEKIISKSFENHCCLNIFGINVKIGFPFSEMSGEKPFFEVNREKNKLLVDLVLYRGEKKVIKLNELESMFTASYISMDENSINKTKIENDDKYVKAEFCVNDKKIQIQARKKPSEYVEAVFSSNITYV